jgi:hypothetical protein
MNDMNDMNHMNDMSSDAATGTGATTGTSPETDTYSALLMDRLKARLGPDRFRDVLTMITDNLEAYAIARDEGLTESPWGTVLELPPGEDLDEESKQLVVTLLDHVLRRVTGV